MRSLPPLAEKILAQGKATQIAIILTACSAFVWHSQHAYFADSEIFSLTLARVHQSVDIGQSYKFLFSLILKLTLLFDLQAEEPLLMARLLFAVVGVVNLLLAASLYKLIFRRPYLEATPIIFILGFTMFFERGFRIRADNLSATWHLLTVWYFMKYWYYRPATTRQESLHIVGLTALELLMVMTTLKAGLMLIALQILYFVAIRGLPSERREQVKRALYWKIRNQVDLTLLALVFVFYFRSSVDLLEVFFGSSAYLRESMQAGRGMAGYFTVASFFHVTKFLRENPLSSLVFYLPLVLVVGRIIRRLLSKKPWADRTSAFYFYCFIVMVFFILFPEKYPFFLASLLPVLSLPGVRFGTLLIFKATQWLPKMVGGRNHRYCLSRILFMVFCLVSLVTGARTVIERSSNAGQIHFIQNMTAYMNRLGKVFYYDVIGMLPDHEPLIAFAGPNQEEENRRSFIRLQAELPPFVFYTRKMTFLEPHINSLLGRRYLNLGQGIFVRGKRHTPAITDTREWMGDTMVVVPVSSLDKEVESLEVIFSSVPEYVRPGEIEPEAFKVPINFFMIEETGAVYSIPELWVEDELGFITVYDETRPWKYVRKTAKNFLFPKFTKQIGISVYPPIDFQPQDSLLFLFAFDVGM